MKFSTKPLQQNWSEKRREIQIKTWFMQQPYYLGTLHGMMMKSMIFEGLAFDGLFWPSLAFLAFVALDEFLKQKLAFADKN